MNLIFLPFLLAHVIEFLIWMPLNHSNVSVSLLLCCCMPPLEQPLKLLVPQQHDGCQLGAYNLEEYLGLQALPPQPLHQTTDCLADHDTASQQRHQ